MKIRRVAIAATVVVATLVPAGTAHGVISGTSGQVTKIAPPSCVDRLTCGLDSDTTAWAWDEQQGVTLASPLRVDLSAPGNYESPASLPGGTIAAGTTVDSHFFDSVPVATHAGVTVTGTLTFPTDIIGVIVLRGKLVTSNVLGSSGTDYTTASTNNDLDLDPTQDGVFLPNSRTITIRARRNTGADVDQVRVITRHDSAPTAIAGGPYTGNEGSPVTLSGTASDPDNDPLSVSWSFTTAAAPGTACTTTNTNTFSPTVSCNDDAVVTASMSVSDPFHAPVVSNATVTFNNVAPVLAPLTVPTSLVALTAPVNVSASFSDVGTNDTHIATIDWGDTTSGPASISETNGAGSLNGSHTYSLRGHYVITVTLTDDNGGISVQTAAVDVNGPPTADAAGPYSGNEGATTGLVGTSIDPENDPLTTTWTFSPASQDPGTICTTTGTSTLAPTIKCNDDAVINAQLSASDGTNPATLSNTSVVFNNVAPVLGSVSSPAGSIAVNASANVSAPFSDVGANDTHAATVNWGDLSTTSASIIESGGSGSLAATHAYSQPGLYTVTITLTDDNGGIDTATIQVLVNTPPIVSAGGPYVGSEGSQMTLLGATASDVNGDTLTYAWTFTWTGDPGTTCATTGTNTVTPSIECNDDAVVTATLSVSDGVNAPVVKVATLTVGNVAPTLGTVVPSATLVPTLTTFSVSAAFGDVGTNDSHTATIGWGDASTTAGNVSELNGSGTVNGSHQYSSAGTFTVTLTLTDDNGGSVVGTTSIVVNTPPTANAGGPYTTVEGTPVALAGTANDADGDALTKSWAITWTGDAGVGCSLTNPTTLTPTVTCTDDATVTATLTVKDTLNDPVTSAATIHVTNAAPALGALTLPVTATPTGTPVAVSGSFTDAGTNDTHTATISWGDASSTAGVISESGGSGTVSGSHSYGTSGTYTVTVTVTDDNGGSSTRTGTVVINGSPVVGAGGPYLGIEGSGVTLAGTAVDPDLDSLTVSWTKSIVSSDPGTTCTFINTATLTPTLTCTDNAVVNVTLTATDGVNPAVNSTATVTVKNVAPFVGATNGTPNPAATGASVSVSAGFADASTNDTHTATINWGDATTTAGTVSEALGSGTASGSHAYAAAGTYHVTVTVTDDNGGSSISTVDVVVNGKPIVDAGGPYTGLEGSNLVLGANASDPENDTLAVSWTKTILTGGPGTVCTFTNTSTLAPTLNCNDNATVSVKVTASDGINAPVSDTATVTILNVAPIVATPTLTPNPANIGASVSLGTTFVDPGVNDTHLATINWGDATTTSGTVSELLGSGSVAGNHAYAAAGNYTVTVTVNDNDGGVGTATAHVVVGSPVTANAGGPYSGFEGSPVNLSGSVTNPGGGPLGISWTITWVGSAGTTCGITGSTSLTPAVTCDDNATVTAELSASDGVSPPATSTATVNIANVAPTIGSITLPVTPIPVNTAIALSATFGDVGTHDTHTATINWGDAAATTGSVTEANGSGTVTGSHPYAAAGTYTVSVTVVDDDSGSVIAAAETYVVVYDPSAGFVTGGGWISSPSGAYTPGNTSDTDYTGKANFGFVSKYLPGSTTPSGNTEFDLKSAGLNFHATGMTYLVVTNNATKAYYAGTGTVNGSGSYGFFVSVLDNGNQSADTFRIKVWNTATNAVVYDNQAGGADTDSATQQISGGSVVIHG